MCIVFKNALLYAVLLPALHSSLINGAVDGAAPSRSKTFEFAYETHDEEGNMKMHHEVQDHMGHRKGTYGYRNSNGLYRFVDYVADNFGYRVSVRTNEPGTSSMVGAHITVRSDQSPKVAGDAKVHPPHVSGLARSTPVEPLRSSEDSNGTHSPKLQLQSAVLFPAPPMIRPPRYKPRSARLAQSNFIEPAFRKNRS